MDAKWFVREDNQVIINTESAICSSVAALIKSDVFAAMTVEYCQHLKEERPPLLNIFQTIEKPVSTPELVLSLLRKLTTQSLEKIVQEDPDLKPLMKDQTRGMLHDFAEEFYNFWRSFDRFMVLRSAMGGTEFEKRPYRSFNETVEKSEAAVRALYRDICENITGDHPTVYRQVAAACDVALIAVPKDTRMPDCYQGTFSNIPFIRQVWIAPPLIIDPPMNKRSGKFTRIKTNFFKDLDLDDKEFYCYPAQIGSVVVFAYFHQQFMSLGCSLSNLFELATDEQISAGPDAIFVYGADKEVLMQYGDQPNVFFDDEENNLVLGAVPREQRFGYFGYLKKMMLTLHNIVKMKEGRMPFHGALVRILLKKGCEASVLIIGDTATGKSESLEAFRLLGKDDIDYLRIIADDMGSLEVRPDGTLAGYGTETGAFVRLDDLQKGYAFQEIDRAIIMSPQKTNARVVLPVTTLKEVVHGYKVDYLLYANNYEEVDEQHPPYQSFDDKDQALNVFREGAAMSKGTTSSTGLIHSYFANVFGPPEYQELHESLAQAIFEAAFTSGVKVGQLRTRLGIPGMEQSGPQEAAEALLQDILKDCEESMA